MQPGIKTLHGWSTPSVKTLFFAILAAISLFQMHQSLFLRLNLASAIGRKHCAEVGGFKDHCKSEHHRSAMFAWSQHKLAVENKASMVTSMNKEREKQIAENQMYIKAIAEVLLLTAVQNMSQRGHRESEGSDNQGNFLAILNTIAKHNPVIEKRMKAHGNAKYTSKNIQNQILETLAEMVQEEIINEVKESEVFSVIADETKDLQKKEQMSFV